MLKMIQVVSLPFWDSVILHYIDNFFNFCFILGIMEDKKELQKTAENLESCYKEIIFKKSFLSIAEGHIGFYEIKFNAVDEKFEALVPVNRTTEYNVPEDFFEELNPLIKIID